MAVIGIDLGTSNSLGAVFKDGRIELIPNAYGSYLTPSVVSLNEDGKVVVGEIAKQRLITHSDVTIATFKRDMGTQRMIRLGKQQFTPEELSSFVIRSIVEDARVFLQEEITEAIISVPAYFHDEQRVATKKAGELAGVFVQRLINEPSAAALASYYDKGKEETFLIFDFGGGTLDVSLVDCFDTMVEIISVAGDNKLGGVNFDQNIATNFLLEHHILRNQLTNWEYAILLKQAESVKQQLTHADTVTMKMRLLNRELESVYTNQRLMEESGEILERIRHVLVRVLRDGDVSASDIDQIVMVGGSSKMPMVQSYIKHLFHKAPEVDEDCDEMIAKGLGMVCAIKERKQEVRDYILTDICPFTLGSSTYNQADPEHSFMTPIIPRNTVLPCSRVVRLYTVFDQQKSIHFRIVQGEHAYADDNRRLGDVEINIPVKPKGEEVIDVRYTYDINGILLVDVTVVSTGEQYHTVISQKMSDAALQERMRELETLKVHPKDVSENQLVMAQLEAVFEQSSLEQRDMVRQLMETFTEVLDQQDLRKIKHYRNYLQRVIHDFDQYDPFDDIETEDESEDDHSWMS